MRQIEIDAESEGVEPEFELPDSDNITHIISMMSELGLASSKGGNISQIDWGDIESWRNVTGIDISPWEAETMRHLSGVYVTQYYSSLDNGCVAPVLPQPRNRDIVAEQFKNLFAMLRGSRG